MGALNYVMPQSYFGVPAAMPYGNQNPYIMPTVVKNIQINASGPSADHQRLAMIYEDVMPAKPFVPSSTTINERLNIYQFVRSSILSNTDGMDISLDGTLRGGGSSLLSFIKFDDMNPYNTYKLSDNKYMGMPEGYLIFRSCYPIREQYGNAICAKDSSAINVRIYKMLEGSFLVNKGKTTKEFKFSDFDEWREVAFYEYIRENIIKKKICPNFVTLYGYFISESCGIDFDAIEIAKFGSEKVKGREPDLLTSKEILEKHTEEMRKKSGLDDSDCDGSVVKLKENADELGKLLNPLDVYESKYPLDIHSGRYPWDMATNNLHERNSSGIHEIGSNVFRDKAFPIEMGKIKYATSSGEIYEVNPYAYKGKTLVLLTESGTHNIMNWATRTYQNSGNVKEMINRGTHTEQEWFNVLFQIMVALYVMQLNKIFIRNFNIENNVLIKDLPIRGAITNYWKYKVDNMDFYLPNLGYLALIDSNFKDINTHVTKSESTFNKVPITNTNKLDGKFIGSTNSLTPSEISEEIFNMFVNAFDTNIFTKEFEQSGGCKPPESVLSKMAEIYAEAKEDTDMDIKPYILKHMTMYLHNRTGTYLRESEILNIRRDDTRDFKKGQMVVFEEEHGTYRFVIYLETNENGTYKIITKHEPSDADTIENNVARQSLFNYSKAEPIAQNYKPNEANLSEDELLETYIIKQ